MAAMYLELVGIADNFIEGTEINVEELLKLDPDVVIYWAEYENQYEALQSVGIPAVGVKGAEGGDVIATLKALGWTSWDRCSEQPEIPRELSSMQIQ